MTLSNSNTTGVSSNSGATAPDITLASLSAQISSLAAQQSSMKTSLHALLTAVLVLLILGLCALLFCLCFQRRPTREDHSSSISDDVEAARTRTRTPTTTTTTDTTNNNSLRTTRNQPRNTNPYNNNNPYGGFEEIPLGNILPPQAHLRAAGPSGSSTSNSNNTNSNNTLSGSNSSRSNRPSRGSPPASMPLPDPRYTQSVGTDYTRVRRAGRYTDEHMNGTGLAGSAHPHHHNAGVSAGSRQLDRIMNS